MTRQAHDLIVSPVGYDGTTEAALLDAGHCQNLVNLLNDRPGLLRGQIGLSQISQLGQSLQGVGYWYHYDVLYLNSANPPQQQANGTSYVLIAQATSTALPAAGSLLLGTPNAGVYPPSVAFLDGLAVVGTFYVYGRVRFIQFADEIVIVQENAAQQNWRLTQSSAAGTTPTARLLCQLGQTTPAFPTVATGTGTLLNGNYFYAQTFVDNKGRESSPSALPVNRTNFTFQAAHVTMNGLNAATVAGTAVSANLYRTTASGSVLYRVNTSAIIASGSDPVYNDNVDDNTLAAGSVLAPNFGENDPPLPASLGCSYNGRLILDVVGQPGVIQISNLASPTQFCVSPLAPTDGVQMTVGEESENRITGLASFMAFCLIFFRRGLYVMEGSSTDVTSGDQFTLRRLHDRGCIAPDSIAQADNHIIWLSDDGVYVAQYFWRFELQKFSKPIEKDLQALMDSPGGREQMQNAIGWFVDNCYHLAIGPTIFRYDFDTEGWTKLSLTGSNNVFSAVVMQEGELPGALANASSGIAIIGTTGNLVAFVDELTPNQTVNGMVYRTRLLQPDQADQVSHSQQPRTLLKRLRRIRVIGEGTILNTPTNSTLTVTCDGHTEVMTYAAPPAEEALRGVLWYYEPSVAMKGRAIDLTLSVNGQGVNIRSLEADYIPIG